MRNSERKLAKFLTIWVPIDPASYVLRQFARKFRAGFHGMRNSGRNSVRSLVYRTLKN